MKKIKFILKNNQEILINREVNYKLLGDTIVYEIDDYVFSVTFNKDKIKFKRLGKEEIFYIGNYYDSLESYVLLKGKNIRFDIKIISFEYIYNNNIMELKYELESDENNQKSISIEILK